MCWLDVWSLCAITLSYIDQTFQNVVGQCAMADCYFQQSNNEHHDRKKTWDEYLQAPKTTCQHLKPLSLKESKRSN